MLYRTLVTTGVVVMLGLAALTLADASAEGHPGGRGPHAGDFAHFGDPARMVDRMARHLDLSDSQRQNLENVIAAARPQMDDLRDRARQTFEAIRSLDVDDPDYHARLNNLAAEAGELATSATLLMGGLRADVSRELTEEQRAELATFMEQKHERMRGRRDRDE